MPELNGVTANLEAPLRETRRKIRLLAYCMDLLLAAGPCTLLCLVLFGSFKHHLLVQEALVGAAVSLYEIVVAMRRGERRGQTIGKQVLKIRVVTIDRRPVTFKDLVLREVVRNILWLPGYLSNPLVLLEFIDPVWVLRNPQNRALHDLLARTIVVDSGAAL